ncbi:MAG: radical SAM protein [Bacteroidales bacterium]|nr:radical SAM protein [Bacteroidales bacterium]
MDTLKFYIIYNGCQLRSLDSTRLHNYIIYNNHTIVDKPDDADFNLVVTCGVIRKQVDSSFLLIEDFLKYRGELIVLGCVPSIAPEEFNNKFKVKYLSTKNMEEIDNFFPNFKIKFRDIPFAHDLYRNHIEDKVFTEKEEKGIIKDFGNEFEFSKKFYAKCVTTLKSNINKKILNKTENREVKYISIASGCRNNCAYCGIRKAIGKLRSKSVEVILKEYKTLLDQGYRHFRIIADDLGAYGLDIGTTFGSLLYKMAEVDKDLGAKWYFEDLNPKWLIIYKKELLYFARKKKIIEMLCPFQSGNNRILKLMNREYNINEVVDILTKFKSYNPLITLISHAIVGFPSESDEEFQDTLKVLEKIDFDELTILGYHDSEGILSHKIEPKIESEVIQERLNRVRALLKKLNTPLPRVY